MAGREARTFDTSPAAWVNVSYGSDYNKIHDHQGASWSGCYYAQDGGALQGPVYSGRLLLKPTPGPLENVYCHALSQQELADLSMSSQSPLGDRPVLPQYAVDAEGVAGLGEYALIDPLPGSLILFPSWLLHAVLPVIPAEQGGPGGPPNARISCAFNV